MPYRSRISILKESHRLIDEQIIVMEANNADPCHSWLGWKYEKQKELDAG